MPVRTPLYVDGTNLREMSAAMIAEIKLRMFNLYLSNPSVTLSVVGSGGSLGSLTDTRLQAGVVSTSVSEFPTEATTAEPSIVSVSVARITQTVATDANPGAASLISFPIYYTPEGNIRTMNLQDMYDTFAFDVLNGGWITSDGSTVFTNGLAIAGVVYTISTATTVAGYTEVSGSSTPVFSDTRANTSAFAAGDIPETEDQPTTIENYYLHRINAAVTAFTVPARITLLTNIETPTTAAMETVYSSVIRYFAQAEVGYRLRYAYGVNGSGTGVVCGSAMTDTRLDGAGNYQTLQPGGDDYRAQEFPDGTAQAINVYTLKLRTE